MRLLFKLLLTAAIAMFLAMPLDAQIGSGAIRGRVLDRDGNPLQGAVIVAVNRDSRDRRIVISRSDAKTNRGGNYSLSGLFQGRYEITLMVDGAPVMVRGQAIGDDIFINDQSDMTVNFDMRKAPAPAPDAPGAVIPLPPAPSAAAGSADRDARNAAANEVKKLFDSGKAALQAAGAAAGADEKLKQYDAAIASFKAAAEKDPKQHVIFANLAKALSDSAASGAAMRPPRMAADEVASRYSDSAAAYRKAIELKPDEPSYLFNLALDLASAGKLEDAANIAEKLSAMNPGFGGQVYYNLGATYAERGQSQLAENAFKKALQVDSNNAKAHYQLGIVYFGSTETIPQAIPHFEAFLKLQPTGPDADAAKALIEAAKAQAPAGYKSENAEAQKKAAGKAKTK
jgi:tetratricopeptide (TPR) repeat protein